MRMSPARCSPPPTSPPPAHMRPKKGTHKRPRGADPGQQQRDPSPARRSRPGTYPLHKRRHHLVKLAEAPPTPGTRLPLPPPRSPPTMTRTAVAVLTGFHPSPTRHVVVGLVLGLRS